LLTPAQDQTPAAASAAPQEQKADQKEPPTPEHTGIHALFGNLGEEIKHPPENVRIWTLARSAEGGALGEASIHRHAWPDSHATSG
jgi:hypothetical protein